MRPAEQLLFDLGIAEPADIQLDAIAHCVGVEVRYRPLSNCEAQIIGFREKAVVYVSTSTKPRRRRFSTGHELGHWHHHRGQSFVCRPDDIGRPLDEKSRDAERLADSYSGDLLLPRFMVSPRLDALGDITLDGIAGVAEDFDVSVTAAAIRAIRMTRQPLILVAHNLFGRRWQWPSITAGRMRVRDDVDGRSTSFSAALAGKTTKGEKKEPAHYWFDRRHIEQFDVRTQSYQTAEGETLTLLRILNPKMIDIYGS